MQCSETGVDLDLYEYRLANQADAHDVMIGETDGTEVTITGLTPCTDLAFSVAAYTSVGTMYSVEVMISIEAAAGRFTKQNKYFVYRIYTPYNFVLPQINLVI